MSCLSTRDNEIYAQQIKKHNSKSESVKVSVMFNLSFCFIFVVFFSSGSQMFLLRSVYFNNHIHFSTISQQKVEDI